MGRTKTWNVLLAVGVSFTGGFAQSRPLDRLDPVEMNARVSELKQTSGTPSVSESELEEGWVCLKNEVSLDVKDPRDGSVRQLTLPMYRPYEVEDGPVPLVIVVPTIEGTTVIERMVARSLCENGIAAVIADVNEVSVPTELPSWGLEDRNNRFGALALSSILDYAETHSDFDKSKFGIMGLSLGGITAAMMAGVEVDRLSAIVITVGGGNLPFTLANSDNKKVHELRTRRMTHLNLKKPEEYEDLLRTNIKYDPVYFAPRTNRDRMLMVMAEKDTKVPFVVQQEQFEAFGKPNHMLFSGGHVGSILSLTFLYMDTVVDFFWDRFEAKSSFDSQSNFKQYRQLIDLDQLGY